MAFNSNDLYTLSGGVTIFNYWNPFVTKHDTSSFYNWEQDNLPLYDLEERTHYLWEKFGYPLSGVPSMALLVSATIPTQLSTSSNVFTSISDAIEALPEIIRMPTLIEVALSGDMGELMLNNIKCEDDGVLEIINRGFAPLAEWSDVSGTGTNISATTYEGDLRDTVNNTPNLCSGVGPINYYLNSSALAFSANTGGLFAADTENGFSRHLSFATGQCQTNVTLPSKTSYAYAGVGEVTSPFRTINNLYINPINGPHADPGMTVGQTDPTIDFLDVSTLGGTLQRAEPKTDVQILNGILTANRLKRIKIENSDGPIYIRGFIVDGYNLALARYQASIGIGVYNCTNISIEDCGAMRCTTAGYEINNSKVKLRRRNLAVRNYEIANRGLTDTYGFKISNSEVEYKTDPDYSIGTAACLGSFFHTYGIHLTNSKLYGGDLANLTLTGTNTVTTSNMMDITPLTIGYNNYGLYADSSKYDIKGLSDIYNNEVNIKAKGSEIRTGRFMIENAAEEGIDFSNSRFILNTDYEKTIRSSNATIYTTSSVNAMPYSRMGMFTQNRRHILLKNGSYYGPDYPTDLSSYQTDRGSLAQAYSMIEYNFAFGTDQKSVQSHLPSISIDNSRAVMPATTLRTEDTNGSTSFVKGIGIQANNGGVCKLIGYGNQDSSIGEATGRTYIIGGTSFLGQQKCSGIAAINNSIIYITGPTGIAQYGIGVLADNNSVVKTCPVLSEDDDSYDGSGWGRMELSVNTCLDIHSTRTCALASNNSQLRFEDLGFFPNFWPTATAAGADYRPLGIVADFENNSASSLCQAGALQFYPNPVDGDIAMATLGSTNFNSLYVPTQWPTAYAYDSSLSCNRVLYSASYAGAATHTDIRANASRGGVCVRATGDSEAFVRNVHFPTGWSQGDGTFLDPSASIAGCNDLFIWNVQDTSRINASFATVSGVYPSLAGYTGPRSTYNSSPWPLDGVNHTSAVAYTSFSGTPDTGTLAVLDHYGSGVEVSGGVVKGTYMRGLQYARTGSSDTYGVSGIYENRGCFRLFFPVNPEAKALSYKLAGPSDTRPYQHLAQGYALSGECSGLSSLSGVFPSLLNIVNTRIVADNPVAPVMSGWYSPAPVLLNFVSSIEYNFDTGDLLQSLPQQRVGAAGYTTIPLLPNSNNANVLLDESFSNTFNNAKHCNTAYSGRRRLVSIYKASTLAYGDSFPGDTVEFGQGFTSTNMFDVERDM